MKPKNNRKYYRMCSNNLAAECSWLVGCRLKGNCPLVGPGLIGGVPSVEVFLRDSIPYLCEFRRKPHRTPNGYAEKRDRGLNH